MALLRKQRAAVREHAEHRDAARPRALALAHHRNVVVSGAVGHRELPLLPPAQRDRVRQQREVRRVRAHDTTKREAEGDGDGAVRAAAAAGEAGGEGVEPGGARAGGGDEGECRVQRRR